MDIASLWIKRKGFEDSPPELLTAWDEYSIDENWEGWAADCEKALKACGDDVAAHRFINFRVDGDKIERLFENGTIEVTTVTELDDPRAL